MAFEDKMRWLTEEFPQLEEAKKKRLMQKIREGNEVKGEGENGAFTLE